MQTLAQLKAENAEKETPEAVEDEPAPQVDEPKAIEEVETEAVEEEAVIPDEVAEPGEGTTEEPETEAWMQTDGEKKFTDGDVGAAKKKLRAKLETKHNDETEKLQARIAELESSGQAPPAQLNKPKRSDYENSDDPDDAYTDALLDWKLHNHDAKSAATATQADQTRQRDARQLEITKDVDSHYERAAKLTSSSGIEPELYQSADLTIRRAVESVFPKQGDAITDGMIANLGDGSEKVFYNLGVNEAKRNHFVSLLQADKTGLKASMYLGKLQAELAAPGKRTTNAPKPATSLNGDAKPKASNAKAQREYDAAHASGNPSKAFNVKLEAKKAGVDTTTW